MSRTYVALLRGINVGGRRKLPMADLRALLDALGHEDVTTYVQSGNAVFRSGGGSAASVAAAIERRIESELGLDVAVMLRTAAQLRAVLDGDPFPKAERKQVHVVFLEEKPGAAAAKRLDPDRSPGDEASLHGRELYLRLGNGAGRTKLTLDWIEKQLGVRGTGRNWNTVTKLAELAGERS
jgi:uncharacterized protein (DUF1697 family)